MFCSDEEPDQSVYSGLPVHFMEKSTMMTDLHILSLCDYSFGPPSSFGTWSSWFGKVPRLVINKLTEIKTLNQFKVSTTC